METKTNLDTLSLSLCPSLDWDRDKHNWVEGFKAGVAAALKEQKSNDMNIKEIIEKAAEGASQNYIYAHDRNLIERGFDAGASFALQSQELREGVMKGFAEWMDAKGWVKTDAWHCGDDSYSQAYTTEELIAKYIQFITDKQ